MKETSLLYFKMFPTHKIIKQKIPKKSMVAAPKTGDGGYEMHNAIQQNHDQKEPDENQKTIKQLIPKKTVEIMTKTHDEEYEMHSQAIRHNPIPQKESEKIQGKPFDSMGKGPYGSNIDWNKPCKKPRTRWDKSSPMKADIKSRPNAEYSTPPLTPPNKSSYQTYDSIPDQQSNQPRMNTIIRVSENTMCVENESGQKKWFAKRLDK